MFTSNFNIDDDHQAPAMTQRKKIEEIFGNFIKNWHEIDDHAKDPSAYDQAITQIETLITEARIDQATYIAEQLTDDQLTKELIYDQIAQLQASLKGKEV